MATKTYYAKLDCRSLPANSENCTNETYYGLMNFLSYLSASNQCTLVSWNSGSSAAAGAFSTRTYWDGAAPFGMGSHSVWKFHTSSMRNWEWYMYVQAVSGSAAINQAFNQPITSSASFSSNASLNNDNNSRGIILQTAVCVSGTTSFNPWGGTVSQGDSTAGSPRWISGSNDRQLYVLPRSNDLGGIHSAQKANSHIFGRQLTSTTAQLRYHFLYDGDAILYLHDRDEAGAYDLTYVGAFELRNDLTASGIGGGPYGFCMLSPLITLRADTIQLNTVFGSTAGTQSSTSGGGIVVPILDLVSGSKGMICNTVGTFFNRTYQPNYFTGKYDEFPVSVGFSELPYYGIAGSLNGGLVKLIVGPEVHQVTADYRNAIFGGSLTLTDAKVIVPWSGSVAPGLGLSRTGSLATWSYDYG
jgi:hypothetical protein